MKFLNSLLLGVIALAITSCVSTPRDTLSPAFQSQSQTQSQTQSIFKLRFQNMLGLKLYYAGCSFQNLGGVERMCQFAGENPADLVFQVGPSFSELLGDPETAKERESKRNALWKIWKIQKVGFYSVDARDLAPSLTFFKNSHRGSSIALLSSNLLSKKGEFLFEPFLIKEFLGKKIVFLSFSEALEIHKEKSWKVESIEASFKRIKNDIESQADLFYILGSLSHNTRNQISSLTLKPILFLGGALEENNSTSLEPLGSKDFLAKAASFGRGFSEIAIGKYETNFWGKSPQIILGGLDHSFWSYLLEPGDLKFNECSKALETAKPQSLATEALKLKVSP